ncbi:MAG: transcription-repair coupling factor [Ruminococcaceae bacterium]|nr:transcription-repair coupling factor [Oscillospiraceae bacterium]
MNGFLKILESLADFEEITGGLKKNQSPVSVTGVSDSVRAHLAFCVCKTLGKNAFIVAANQSAAKQIFEDMKFFFDGEVLFFPEKELVFYDIEAAANDIKKQRLEVLDKLACGCDSFCVVTTASALMSATVPKKLYEEKVISLSVGDEIELDELCSIMVDLGYKREEMVEGPGQFSVRGGIFDFFPYWNDMAFRVEFFDTMVDSVREFYVETQRTVTADGNTVARITPASELVADNSLRKKCADMLREEASRVCRKKEQTEETLKLVGNLKRDAERIEEGILFPSRDRYIPYFYSEKIPTLLDYAGENFVAFLAEPSGISEAVRAENIRFDETLKDMLERGIIPKSSMKYRADYSVLLANMAAVGMVAMSSLSHSNPDIKPKKLVSFTAKSLGGYNGKMEFFYDALDYYRKNKYRTVILAGSERRAENLYTQLLDEDISCTLTKRFDDIPEAGKIIVTQGGLSRGFEYPLIRTVVISDKEIFGETKKKRKHFRVSKENKIDSFTDLNVGDFVVHQNHGIGQYVGIERLSVEGAQKDYLKIIYKGGDNLYVPADQLNLIYKHIGRDGGTVKLNSLGGQEWNRAKQKVKNSCQDMAKELVELYAQRESIRGIEFSKDTEWQHDFEAAFQYEETDDQLRCIEEVKKDMEKPRPMERLLCGDVGYGKTEVAMRAAFKAVMDGYQVAYLVPTTILANQHYNNFRQRMKDYPVNIACLSRFCTPKQQKDIVNRLKTGEIDIVIGTHKILQKSVEFRKLGLLIIDEEQRFGVAHKERIKEMKKEIDVLTLSATPIPRTLHMSMSGIRDMSIIAEPPSDRYPVATYVMEFDLDIVREAIAKEIGRGGQVYYLHNRVQGIEKTAAMISDMLPDARVATAHGKMTESELERIMMAMSENEIDVLVCTTIIETGLDIANVNTIIIEDADRLGLAQLYQLRGRVGRSNRLAYAYLTYHRDKVLNEDAQKRLKAIREFTEFGSGFKIAMRDLEIRGTGNVVGVQQSGHMDSVGYDMYCKLLAEAVKEMQGIPVEEEVETTVDFPVSAFIPESYIKAHSQRILAYKRIAAIESNEELSDAYDELLDRYGDVPVTVNNLMLISLIRKTASKKLFTDIKGGKNNLVLNFEPDNAPDLSGFVNSDYIKKGKAVIKTGKKPKIIYSFSESLKNTEYLNMVKEFIEKV